MKSVSYLYLIFSLLVFSLCSCSNRGLTQNIGASSPITNTKKDCPKDLMCTMDYRMITIKISHKEGLWFQLDSVGVYFTDQPTKSLYLGALSDATINSYSYHYLLAEDGNMSQVQRNGTKITLVGYKNNNQVVKQDYLVGHDCCHIQLISGPKEIIVSEYK